MEGKLRLQGGMSGSPALRNDMVTGILAGAGTCRGTIIPARTIRQFIKTALAKSAP
ncbi:MAG: hypothetical protein AAB869_02825 [Patescibacteria group bacterium]